MTQAFCRMFITVESSAVPPIACRVRSSGSDLQEPLLAIVKCASLDALETVLQSLGATGYSSYVSERPAGPEFGEVPSTPEEIVAQLGGPGETTLTAIAGDTTIGDMRHRVSSLRESALPGIIVEPA